MPSIYDPDRAKGLHIEPPKFQVERTDGSTEPGGKHEHCDFFVLDLHHDKFSVAALQAYIDACAPDYPKLAIDLQEKVREARKRFGI